MRTQKIRKNKMNYMTILFIALAVILAIGIVSSAARYFHEIDAARVKISSLGSQIIETACGPVEYSRVGGGSPVLVIHGDMGGFDQGLMTAKPVIDAGFEVISVSRFGYLRTPMPDGATVTMQADAYACLLDALGIQQTAVFAFSSGATSAIRFAARHPERISALVLLCPAAPGEVQVSSPPKFLFETLMRSDFLYWAIVTYLKPYTLIGVPKSFALTPAYEAEVKDILATTLPLSDRMDGFLFDTYDPQLAQEFYLETSETSPYPLSQVKTPVLVIHAEDDPYAVLENVRGLAAKLPNARQFILPDGGHPILGHSEELQAQVSQFLYDYAPVLEGVR